MLEGLERVAMAGVRKAQRVMGLARGLGAQAAAEREEWARKAIRQREVQERAQAVLRAEVERQEAARLAERERVAAELRQKAELDALARRAVTPVERAPQPRLTAEQWDAATYWKGLAEEGRKLRQADREGQEPEKPREREGPSLGM